jgi:hypothetical protein
MGMTSLKNVNDPEVVAELSGLLKDYERALVDNDVAALTGYFWDSPDALRFGVAEELYGAEEIEAFRRTRKVNFTNRKVLRENVVTLGTDFAVATVEFQVTVNGLQKHGRQSQVWVRFPDLGWRIVSAHVSHKVVPGSPQPADPAAAYAMAADRYVGPASDPAYRDGVTLNLQIAARIAAPLLALELPADIEIAPRFIP